MRQSLPLLQMMQGRVDSLSGDAVQNTEVFLTRQTQWRGGVRDWRPRPHGLQQDVPASAVYHRHVTSAAYHNVQVMNAVQVTESERVIMAPVHLAGALLW